ncbi:shikimate dehydrogenase [Mangrovibacillus cuniculi]|uniref:Shikimate dehydrogenase (NADP(+)) n=1 Tax=Mangrovibacillus cuniculi TaxID=2593652 RepID=A0A7S8HFL2_9BACI|nr:shikimate dehydrogenase [Mangrovibacillus cuniculi]QPC46958.1 shikimate dehydrogenase [Mangrovibacillus cuniculi]
MKLAVIGYPIHHSLSPLMHQVELDALGIQGNYTRIEIHPNDFTEKVTKLLDSDITGFNVTLPFKEKIIPYLDDVDSSARVIGAVNTVVKEQGKWIGYNTDGEGYVRGLLHDFSSLELPQSKVLIIGAGGAARGIIYSLLQSGVQKNHLDIMNRSLKNAQKLCEEFSLPTENSYSLKDQCTLQYDIVIQTSSVGLKKEETPLRAFRIQQDAIVSDIIYNPSKTAFLKIAEEQGAMIQNGLNMFVFQGALAFEKWTSHKPNISRMRDTVLGALNLD